MMKLLLKKFKTLEGSFLHNHSFLTSTLAITAGKKFNWMNKENEEKLYLGSILHDLGIRGKLTVETESATKTELMKLDEDQRQDLLIHPTLFAVKLNKLENIHSDVIKMISGHHGINEHESYPRPIHAPEASLILQKGVGII